MGVAERGVGHEQRPAAREPSARRPRRPSPETAGETRVAAPPAGRIAVASGSAAAPCPVGRATPGKPLTVISAA